MQRGWFYLLIILAITLLVSSCVKPSIPAPTPLPAPQVTPTLPPEIEKGLLVLSHSTYVDKYGYFHLVGEVQNLGNRNTEQNRVRVDFYDEEGATYATASGECYREIILPGENSPFEIVFPRAPEAKNYKLTADWQVTNKQPNRRMVVTGAKSTIDADGYYVVTGEIVNQEERAIENVMVLGTFYDSSGKVVAVGFSFPDTIPIRPGSSNAFSLVLAPGTSSSIDKFFLQLEYTD